MDKATKNKINIDTKGAQQSIDDLGLTFNAANEIFSKSVDIIRDMVEQYANLDKAVTEFKKVSDLSGASLDKYVDKLGQMGTTVARGKSEMVEAASMFRKSGFSDEDAATLALVAAQFQNVADTEISASEAAASITSQIRAFGLEASDASHIIDAYNQVANNFSVGTNDISNAMEIASAGMATYGNSFEQIIGLTI